MLNLRKKPRQKMSSIIFDLDGTLLDTLDDLSDSMNAALTKLGWPQHPIESYRFFVGRGLDALVQQALPSNEQLSVLSRTKLRTAMQEEYTIRWKNKSRPYKGVEVLLNELTNRHIPMAILSNKPDSFTQDCARQLLSQWKFTIVRGAQVGIPYKPDPTSALDIAQKMNLDPSEIFYVGDTNTDMETALNAGMIAVGATWGFRSAKELIESGAHHLIDTPAELLRHI